MPAQCSAQLLIPSLGSRTSIVHVWYMNVISMRMYISSKFLTRTVSSNVLGCRTTLGICTTPDYRTYTYMTAQSA